jgi:hypothetical protein
LKERDSMFNSMSERKREIQFKEKEIQWNRKK